MDFPVNFLNFLEGNFRGMLRPRHLLGKERLFQGTMHEIRIFQTDFMSEGMGLPASYRQISLLKLPLVLSCFQKKMRGAPQPAPSFDMEAA